MHPEIIITLAASHTNVVLAGREGVRQMAFDTVREACRKAHDLGARPLSAVDDLSMHASGDWIDDFASGLAEAAKLENISICGGEMAQMGDTYRPDYIGVVVYVVALK